ncbi:ATP-grasp domain-containing protein [Salinivibrio sp. VYel6]|uniref:ATP-grasp domain-containing protein n=1 Tax=Salinivibrio sp. VYel6 TaxID=2490493 RepID=UPI00128D3E1E|nr:ATP-grasp domain-containing protein [Salinivibrio sp. VYel6]MPX98259.1 ATP-grasp domain-containing protein [Salinivibrio sp. VYel6]
MIKILILSGGAGNGFTFCKTVKEKFSKIVDLHVADTNEMHLVSSSIFSKHYHKVPHSLSPGYKENIKSIINNNHIDIVIPLINQDFLVLSELSNGKEIDCDVKFSFPVGKATQLLLDKEKCNLFLSELGIPVPETYFKYEQLPDCFFVKPRNGFGSKNAQQELKKNYCKLDDEFSYQEFLSGEEVTVDCFSDIKKGYVHITCRERLEVKSGVCTKARLFFDQELYNYAKKISFALKFEGGFCFQVMKKDNQWKVIDLNMRLGAGTSMSSQIGNDYFSATLNLLLDMPYESCFAPDAFNEVSYVTRQYQEFLTYEKKNSI